MNITRHSIEPVSDTSFLQSNFVPLQGYSEIRQELELMKQNGLVGGLALNRKNLYKKMHHYQQN